MAIHRTSPRRTSVLMLLLALVSFIPCLTPCPFASAQGQPIGHQPCHDGPVSDGSAHATAAHSGCGHDHTTPQSVVPSTDPLRHVFAASGPLAFRIDMACPVERLLRHGAIDDSLTDVVPLPRATPLRI